MLQSLSYIGQVHWERLPLSSQNLWPSASQLFGCMSIPAHADENQRYSRCQAGLLLLLKDCASSSSRIIPICSDTSNGQNQASAEHCLPLEILPINIWVKNHNGPPAYTPQKMFSIQIHSFFTSSDISPYFSTHSRGAGAGGRWFPSRADPLQELQGLHK